MSFAFGFPLTFAAFVGIFLLADVLRPKPTVRGPIAEDVRVGLFTKLRAPKTHEELAAELERARRDPSDPLYLSPHLRTAAPKPKKFLEDEPWLDPLIPCEHCDSLGQPNKKGRCRECGAPRTK